MYLYRLVMRLALIALSVLAVLTAVFASPIEWLITGKVRLWKFLSKGIDNILDAMDALDEIEAWDKAIAQTKLSAQTNPQAKG
jgi:hypothetical protein